MKSGKGKKVEAPQLKKLEIDEPWKLIHHKLMELDENLATQVSKKKLERTYSH